MPIRIAPNIFLKTLAAFGFALLALLLPPSRPSAAALLAQLTLPATEPSPSGIEQAGIYVTAPVDIDGTTLFRIVTPVSAAPGQIPIALRQSDVQTSLAELLAQAEGGRSQRTEYDPQSLRVHARRDSDGDVVSLEAVDAKHADPFPIVTVTTADANYHQESLGTLATEWQAILQSSLIRALERRQPAVERRSLQRVGEVALALGAATVLVWVGIAVLSRRASAAEDEAAQSARDAEAQVERVVGNPEGAHHGRRRFLAVALKGAEPQARANFFRSVAEAAVWALVLAWFVAATWALGLFPQTSPLASSILQGSSRVLLTLLAIGLLNRLLDILIARIARLSERQRFVNSEDRARLMLRIPTIARALSGFKTFIFGFLAVLTVLGEIGVPIGSVVTIGGLTAIALSLAAQNFVRDFVNGSLVLFEDQYVVGDYITINAASGIVETLTLRMVQLRDAAGEVITIPHSSVTAVINQSRNWSRVDYRVPVDPSADLPKAIGLVRTAIEEIAAEERWRGAVTLPVEWIGIDALSKDWAIVRASIRTAPLRQFELRRELNARVIAAFVAGGIALGAQLPV